MESEDSKYYTVRARILGAAAAVFARLGFDKATVNDIANAVHRAKSSIYYYFSSKEEIFSEIVKQERRRIMVDTLRAIDGEPNAPGKLRAYLETRIEGLENAPSLRSVLVDGYVRNSGELDEYRKSFEQESRTVLSNILKEGRRNGLLDFVSEDVAVGGILTIVRALEMPILFGHKSAECDTANVVHIVLDGLRTR